MNTQERIMNMTPEQFEQECVNLLRYMKPKPYKIVGTRYVKDGGKDIRATVDNVPYEIWAECKKHKRSLGLDDISKNVVLVISNKVNELCFFSTSDITLNAQRNINIVAEKYGFLVSYHYGEKLYQLIDNMNLKKNIKKFSNNKELEVKCFLTTYKDAEKYSETTTLVLTRDNTFYIDMFLHNNTVELLENIHIDFLGNDELIIKIQSSDNDFNIYPYTDRFVRIKGEVLNSRHVHRIPTLIINYELLGKKKELINCGIIDPTKLIYFPLIGQQQNDFILNKIKPIIHEESIDSKLIDIRGASGNGKSRIIKEICDIGRNNNYRIIHYDCMKKKDISVLKKLLCEILYIPYNNGDITATSQSILSILEQRGSNADFAQYIYSFIFKSVYDNETLYYVKQSILHFLAYPLFEERIILAFDNIQELSIQMLDILKDIIDGLYQKASDCILIICTNTELIPPKNREMVDELLTIIGLYSDDFHIQHICDEMTFDDAQALYMHALNTDNQYYISKLIEKSGLRPFDIIMIIKYLQDEKIITWQGMSIWYIEDFSKLDKFLISIPDSSKRVLTKRLNKQKENPKSSYWKTFRTVIKLILYFGGYLPIQFVEYNNIDEDDIETMCHSLFIKYDDDKPMILFFHDNIHRFFDNQKSFRIDVGLAKKIRKWITDNPEINIDNKDALLYKIYLYLLDFDSAKDYGINAVKRNYFLRNYEDVSFIGRQILSNSHLKLTIQNKFEIMYMIADSERERVNHDNGSIMFYDSFELLRDNALSIVLTNQEYNKYMHDCVNSQINVSKPSKALEILKEFEKSSTLDDFYRFIIYNRYSVAYLALGKGTEAENKIKIALKLAKTMCSNYLMSISYSDLAFIYLNYYEDANCVKTYFRKAVKKGGDSEDPNRDVELFQQEALCYCLEGDQDKALVHVNKSIELGEQIRNTFLIIKAITLKGIIYAYKKDIKESLDSFNSAIVKCDENHSIVGKIKAFTNMAAICILQNDEKKGKEYVDIAMKLYRKSELSPIKHRPLFYNYITLYSKTKPYELLYKEIVNQNDEKVLRFLDYTYNISSIAESFGVLKIGDAIFSY